MRYAKHYVVPFGLLGSLSFVLCVGLSFVTVGAQPTAQTSANVMAELTFKSARAYRDPFNDVTLDAVFTDPGGKELRVPAFWAGANLWKTRYASPLVGTHRFRTECSQSEDKGLHGITGTVEVKPYLGQNALYKHGPLQVAPNRRYLEHGDGTPFFWLGDTWWMGLCHRIHWPDDFKTLAADRKEKGFNVIQIVAGLYPDMHPFDPRGANEAGYPWEMNYTRIRPEYFDAADQRLEYLVEQGFTPCIVGAWGYFIPWMGVEKMKSHWRYLIARYGAMPVVWCAAGEANLPWYLAKGFPYDDRKQVSDWTEIMRYIRVTDPFHRLLTVHPTGIGRLSARHATDDTSLLDFDMLQTPHGERNAVSPTVHTVRESYADKPVMPVINGEAAYEMLGDSLPTEWTRRMFWVCMMNGAAGHTYGANGIWQANRKGQPHGPSPPAGSPPTGYGIIPWDDAMKLPGSAQIGWGKKLLEQYAWEKFQPHPEWAEFADKSALNVQGSKWIWFPEGNPSQNAPAEKRFFRRTFVLPSNQTVAYARVRIAVDDRFTAWLNGHSIGHASGWQSVRQFNIPGALLRSGTNVLAVEARNMPASGSNPAGLIAALDVSFSKGETLKLTTDADWSVAKAAPSGWEKAEFDDSRWPKAIVVARYGDSPWGRIEALSNDGAYGPQSAGISNDVRIIYVPESQTISVRGLGPDSSYKAKLFDPVSGGTTQLGKIHADGTGRWQCPPPASCDHDWVLIIEKQMSFLSH
jgi:hypothetical protein